MSQQVKIDVDANTGGAQKNVAGVERAADNLAEALDRVDDAAGSADQKLGGVGKRAKDLDGTAASAAGAAKAVGDIGKAAQATERNLNKAADAAKKLEQTRKALQRELKGDVSLGDAEKFSANFERMRAGKGIGSRRLRDFDSFDSWYRGHTATFRQKGAAAAHRMRTIQTAMQGTEWAAGQLPPPPEPEGGGGGRRGNGGGLLPRLGSSGLRLGAGALGMAGIGVGIAGILSMVGQGVSSATDESLALDTLKRRLAGAANYRDVQQSVRGAGDGLGISYTDSASMAIQYAQEAGTAGAGIGSSLRTSFGLARSLGIDPGQAAGFAGTMSRLGVARDDGGQRKLATLIAEAIEKGGFTAKANEVLEAVANYAESASRASLSTPNVGAYLSDLTALTGTGYAGLDPSGAASIIGRADSAMRKGGAMGEASMNLSYAALANGYNPVVAQSLWAGGLFATPDSVFGRDANGKFNGVAGQWASENGVAVPTGNRTNLEGIVSELKRQYGNRDPWLLTSAIQGQFGLQSPQEAMALQWMAENPAELGGTRNYLGGLGIDVSKMTNFSGIADIAKLRGIDNIGGLRPFVDDVEGRSDVTDVRKHQIHDAFEKGDVGTVRDAISRILASNGQVATPGSETRASLSDLKDALTSVGSELLVPLNAIRDAAVGIYSFIAPQEYRDRMQAEKDASTDFDKKISTEDRDGDAELRRQYGRVDSDYDAAMKNSKDGGVDINAIAPQPEHHWYDVGDDSYDYQAARHKHAMSRWMSDGGNKRAAEAMAFYKQKGWSPEQSAGIVANLMEESGLYEGAVGDSGGAHGLAQWHRDRQAVIEKHFGKPLSAMSFRDQLEAVDWELRNQYGAAGTALSGAKSARDAAEIVDRRYEISANQARDSLIRGNDADRLVSMDVPKGDPNGTREIARNEVHVHGTADIRLLDSKGNEVASAQPNLFQMPGMPTPSGGFFSRPITQ